MLDLKSDVGGSVVLNKPRNGKELVISLVFVNNLFRAFEFSCELAQTNFVLDESVCGYFFAGLFPRIHVDWRRYVRFNYAAVVLFVSGVDSNDQTELIFLSNKTLTFLLKDVSENFIFENMTSPFLLNYFTVSPSSFTYSK